MKHGGRRKTAAHPTEKAKVQKPQQNAIIHKQAKDKKKKQWMTTAHLGEQKLQKTATKCNSYDSNHG